MKPALTSRFDPHQELASAIDRRADPVLQPALRACVPQFLGLLERSEGGARRPGAAAVRRITARSCVRWGRNPGKNLHWDRLEEHVRLILGELARIRRKQRQAGRWSDLPVTPLMFG